MVEHYGKRDDDRVDVNFLRKECVANPYGDCVPPEIGQALDELEAWRAGHMGLRVLDRAPHAPEHEVRPTVALFQLMQRNGVLLGEDVSFCHRVRDFGETVWMYLGEGSPVDHVGELTFTGEIEAFGLRRVAPRDHVGKGEERARASGPDPEPETVAGALAAFLRPHLPVVRPPWPALEYQKDPAGFAREILGISLMPEQIEILEAIRDHVRVAVRGGRKVGKDYVLSAAALWFFCCFPDARVRFTAVTDKQVNDIFWRELRLMLGKHGRCVDCKRADPYGPRPCPHSKLIPEAATAGKLARTGLKADDFREIIGYTAREAEGAAGVSGAFQLNIIDEASGIEDFIVEAIDGNLGGCIVGRIRADLESHARRGPILQSVPRRARYLGRFPQVVSSDRGAVRHADPRDSDSRLDRVDDREVRRAERLRPDPRGRKLPDARRRVDLRRRRDRASVRALELGARQRRSPIHRCGRRGRDRDGRRIGLRGPAR